MTSPPLAIGIDLGGSFVKGGLCELSGTLVGALESVPTHAEHGFERSFAQVLALIDRLLQNAAALNRPVVALGIGAPGPMSHALGVIHRAPNLPGWVNIPLRDLLEKRYNLPVTVENDANAAAYGEFTHLRGQRHEGTEARGHGGRSEPRAEARAEPAPSTESERKVGEAQASVPKFEREALASGRAGSAPTPAQPSSSAALHAATSAQSPILNPQSAGTLIMLTLGTGIGGGVILDGRLWRGAFDNAGEIGHTIIIPDGRPCPCGQRGCLERYASAAAIAARYAETRDGDASGDSESTSDRDSMQSCDAPPRPTTAESAAPVRDAPVSGPEAPDPITAEKVAARAAAGDPFARQIWLEAADCLAIAIVNLQHLLNPEIVLLGGGLATAGDQLLTPVRQAFARRTWQIAPDPPQIALALLGPAAGTIGAAMLALEAHSLRSS